MRMWAQGIPVFIKGFQCRVVCMVLISRIIRNRIVWGLSWLPQEVGLSRQLPCLDFAEKNTGDVAAATVLILHDKNLPWRPCVLSIISNLSVTYLS